ncbi:GDSL-type esterase/lipase family protein [Ancylobacter sp. VNQ12]|uniref:SGNH/GDSL hydrolase family protein n=1 Tax=Ancylobacter sp. VNQ12 TaxID=3400920 RepID=UPI003BFA935D
MAARRFDRALKVLAAGALLAGALLLASPPVLAQSDWFRPPGNVGQPSSRPSQPQRQQQVRPPVQQRQQAPSRAQQRQAAPAPRESWSPFQPLINLFGGDRPRTVAPRLPRGVDPAPVVRAPVVAPPAEPRGTVFENVAAARSEGKDVSQVVLVLGDEYAGPLAQGLADAFAADREGVAVAGRSEAGSGLGPASSFDWLSTIRQLSPGEPPNVIVLFAGANDLAPIDDPAGRAELLDLRWREIYGRRLDEVLASLKALGRPVAVVGLPPVEDDDLNERRTQYNALVKDQVERAGLIFVDASDGFVDENGKFMMSGPAVDGQRRRLRTADGIGFTRAGGRKLAFFVDRELDDLLSRPGDATPAAATQNPADTRPSIILLTGGAAPGARALAGAPGGTAPAAMPAVSDGQPEPSRVLVSGEALPAVAGRTDDFRWPAGQPAATAEPLVPAMPGGTALPSGPVPALAAPGTPTSGAGMGTAAP